METRSVTPSIKHRIHLGVLKGQRVVITGPAAGVGRNLAHVYSKHGAAICLADIMDTAAVEEECRALGASHVFSIKFDAGKEGEGSRMIQEACTRFSALIGGAAAFDTLVLNHTIGVFKPMLQQPDLLGTARRNISINFMGYVEIQIAAMEPLLAGARERRAAAAAAGPARSCLGRKRAPAQSRIVCISTLAAKIPMLNTHAYAASKAAVTSWFNCLRLELRQSPELSSLLGISMVYFSAIKTETLLRAMGPVDGPNAAVIALASDPLEAAFVTVEAGVAGKRDTFFPANIGIMPRLYALWPWLVRRIVQSVVVKQLPEEKA